MRNDPLAALLTTLPPAAAVIFPAAALGGGYPTVEQAQRILCPSQTLEPLEVTLTDAEASRVEKLSGDKVRERKLRVWRTSRGGAFFIDRVRGKHEWITYAASFGPDGKVGGIEILDYREAYGHEVGRPEWRAQFEGKRAGETSLLFDSDIKNISGATISCRNVTRGVRRLAVVFEHVVRPRIAHETSGNF